MKLGLTTASAATGEALSPHEQIAENYRRTFGDGPGADVLFDLKKRFGNRRSFVPDSNTTAFHEGQRDVYLMILHYLEPPVNRKPQLEEEN